MNQRVARLHADLADILARHVEPLFKPGMKVTLIARCPGNDDADALVTSDTLDGIAEVVERSRTRGELTL